MTEQYTPEQIQELFEVQKTFLIVALIVLIILFALTFVFRIYEVVAQQEFKKNLNEHDKAVITDYECQNFYSKLKSKKNEKAKNNNTSSKQN